MTNIIEMKLPEDLKCHVFEWLTDVDRAAYERAFYGIGMESIQRQYIRDRLCIICRSPCRSVDGVHRMCKKTVHINREINEEVIFFKYFHSSRAVCRRLHEISSIFTSALIRMIRKSDPCIPACIYQMIADGDVVGAINHIEDMNANVVGYMKECYSRTREAMVELLPHEFGRMRWTASVFMSIHCMTKKELYVLFLDTYPDQKQFIKSVGERVERSVRAYNTLRVSSWIQESCRRIVSTECTACSGECVRTLCVGCVHCQNHNSSVCENRLLIYDRLRTIIMQSVDDKTIMECPEPLSLTMTECVAMRSNVVQVIVACVVWFERMRMTERFNIIALRSLAKYFTRSVCLTERCPEKISLTLFLLSRIGNVTELLTPGQLMLMNEIQIFDLLNL